MAGDSKFIESFRSDPRITVRRDGSPDPDGACVLYWMQRAQRAIDNPALDAAIRLGNELGKPVVAFLGLMPSFPRANLRHFHFLVEGLPDLAVGLRQRHVGFLLRSWPHHPLLKVCEELRPSAVIGDENPLREPERWRQKIAAEIRVPFWTVDADVIVPSRLLLKQQYAARTIRPRIHARLAKFLAPSDNPVAKKHWKRPPNLASLCHTDDLMARWKIDRSVQPVSSFRGGTNEALRLLDEFVQTKLRGYAEQRNHPELDGTSRLSPYLHFGQIGPQTIALAVRKAKAPASQEEAFLEELIVRRELAINFVRFNPDYDSIEGAPGWALRTLADHANDLREVLYSEKQLENSETHDPLWNAAQKQMVLTGWMHNYMRMYWAKKILEWTRSPAAAFDIALRLNDKYELDGRDPNGYEGVAWAIAGKSDRPWFERPVFGTIRYMSYASTSRKFDSESYIRQIEEIEKKGSLR
ncbi:MAG: deoxyribodipyrimidine photo-lyase [Acidobacteriota bacterium]|nr:deoxyribodipyrimidine photo-lyase [Acidobacteriota bacterium]